VVPLDADRLITEVFQYALSRDPDNAERNAARGFFKNQTVTAEAVEDLLWSILLTPEFQYIL
jgi:hypothetical protein